MLRTKLEEGFKEIVDIKEAKKTVKNGYAYYDTGTEEIIISVDDIPLAFANTPINLRAKIILEDSLEKFVTTSGNLVMDCNITDKKKKTEFLTKLTEYQAASYLPKCPYIIEESKMDPNNWN